MKIEKAFFVYLTWHNVIFVSNFQKNLYQIASS
jgi:hypothetical protein